MKVNFACKSAQLLSAPVNNSTHALGYRKVGRRRRHVGTPKKKRMIQERGKKELTKGPT